MRLRLNYPAGWLNVSPATTVFSRRLAGFGALLSDRTRLVILNTPHNPSATVWHHADFDALWQAIKEREIFVISDEVYEHICFAKRACQCAGTFRAAGTRCCCFIVW